MRTPWLVSVATMSLFTATIVTATPHFIVPADLSASDPAAVRFCGTTPGRLVELSATRRASGEREVFVGRARFRSGRDGCVDLARDAPIGGTYAGVDKAGLFWSALPAGAGATAGPSGAGPDVIRLDARGAGRPLAHAFVRTSPPTDALRIEAVDAFPGAVFARPADEQRRPVILVLGGSEGGTSTATTFAPLFAARGFAVLGLPYYAPAWDPGAAVKGLPTAFTEIPVDRLLLVRDWLAARPDVDATRIGIWGASKGAEFALIAASRYPWVRAVVAVVPSDVVWEGWGGSGPPTSSFAIDGKALPFVPYDGMDVELAKAARGEAMDLRAAHVAGRARYPDRVAEARIPVEAFRGPLLLVSGEQDKVWPSADMARAVTATRRAAGLDTELLVAAHAGHGLSGTGYTPAALLVGGGGDPAAIAAARLHAWRRTLALFARGLAAN